MKASAGALLAGCLAAGCTAQRSPLHVVKEPVKVSYQTSMSEAEIEPCVVMVAAKIASESPIVAHDGHGGAIVAASGLGYTMTAVELVPIAGGTRIDVHGGYDDMTKKFAECTDQAMVQVYPLIAKSMSFMKPHEVPWRDPKPDVSAGK